MDYYNMNPYVPIANTDSYALHDMIESDIKDSMQDDKKYYISDQTLNEWITTISASSENSTSTKRTHSSGNTDPNLLVNPQTALPVGMSCGDFKPMPPPPPSMSHSGSSTSVTSGASGSSGSSGGSGDSIRAGPSSSHIEIPTRYDINTKSLIKLDLAKPTPSSSLSPTDSFSPITDSPILTIGHQEKNYPKPAYSYSCLIAMALKNSDTGALPVSEIYNFMTENFPYFKTARDGWKNSVRHNLSLNKCFEKIDNPKASGCSRKGCLWGLNPKKIEKMEDEITKWRKKDSASIKRSMANPDILEILEKGHLLSMSPRHPNNISANSSFKSKISRCIYPPPITSPTPTPPSPASSLSVSEKCLIQSSFSGKVKISPQYMLDDDTIDSDESITDDDDDDDDDDTLSDLALQNGLWDDISGLNDITSMQSFPYTNIPSTSTHLPKTAVMFPPQQAQPIKNQSQLTRLLCNRSSPISLSSTSNIQRSPRIPT